MADKGLISEAPGWPGALLKWGLCQSQSNPTPRINSVTHSPKEKRLKGRSRGLVLLMSRQIYSWDSC